MSWPHWREHRLRTALTVVGVALGVATVVGMADVSATVLASFRHMVDTISGDTPLEVSSPSGKVAESLAAEAGTVTGVRAAAGIVEAFLPLADRPDESLYVIGVDLLGSPVWEAQFPRDQIEIEDELEFLTQTDSVVLTREFMTRHGLSPGDPVSVLTPAGPRTLHVRGVLGSVPAARLFDGALAAMDLPAAERLLGLDAEVDRIAVQLAPDAEVATVQQALRAALGPGVEVEPPESRGRQVDRLLLSLRAMLATMSACAVIVGTLIVFQTVAVSVHQRRRQFALVNVAGVSPRAILRLCLTETALLAAVGVLLGLGGGWLLGRLGAGIVGGAVSDIWVRVDVAAPARSIAGTVVGVVAALTTALAASFFAIRATFAATTVEALRPGGTASADARVGWRGLLGPLLVAASSWLIVLAPAGSGFVTVVTVIIVACCAVYLGGALIAPALVLVAARVARRLEVLVPQFPVRLAIDNLPRDPARSGATVGTIIVAMAIAANVACTVESFDGAWLGWVREHFVSDLVVGTGSRLRWFGAPVMRADLADTLRGIPGVEAVEPFRVRRIEVGGEPAFLQGISLDSRLAHGGMMMVQGRLADAAPALKAGTGVLVTDGLAARLGLHPGDAVTLATPRGEREFRVEGTYTDYVASIDLGAIGVDYEQLVKLWDDHGVNLFRVWVAPGSAASDVRTRMLGRLGSGSGYFVLTAGQLLDSFQSILDRFFLATWALQVIAAVVGVIGVVNAQLATVLDRAVEIATLRTIGVSARDITRSTLVECAILGALGGLGGIAFGILASAEIVTVGLRLVTGLRLPFALSPGPLALGIVVATLVSALAGYVPARAAAAIRSRGLEGD